MGRTEIAWPARLVGGVVGAGGAWFALPFSSLELSTGAVGGIAAAMGLVGLYLGPKIWEAVVALV